MGEQAYLVRTSTMFFIPTEAHRIHRQAWKIMADKDYLYRLVAGGA